LRTTTHSNRYIVEKDVEPRRPLNKVVPNQPAHILTLRDQLACVELRDHTLQHLVHDTGQYSFIVVRAECPIYLRQRIDSRSREHTAGDVDHLQILCAGEGGDVAWFRTDVVGDGGFEPWEAQMGAFVEDLLANTSNAGVLDCAMTSVHCLMLDSYQMSEHFWRYTVEECIVEYPDRATQQQ